MIPYSVNKPGLANCYKKDGTTEWVPCTILRMFRDGSLALVRFENSKMEYVKKAYHVMTRPYGWTRSPDASDPLGGIV